MRNNDYMEAMKAGQRAYRRATYEGRYPYLPALDDLLEQEGRGVEVPVGTIEIPLANIVGTMTRGRQQAFSGNFLPIMRENTEFAMKWAALYTAHVTEGIHDAIKCYEYKKRFYVMEGNKRVSVMKYAGAEYITANVTRILPVRTDDKDCRLYYEFVEFYNVAPTYEIDFTEEGYYHRFAEIIGQNLTDPWPTEVMQDVKAAYATFAKIFKTHGGEDLSLTTGDAFLIYISIYPMNSLNDEAESVSKERVSRLWNEFLTRTHETQSTLVEDPDQVERTRSILDLFSSIKVYTKEDPLKVAFLYSKNPDNSSWVYGHELGRQYVQDKFGGIVDTIAFHDCPDGESVRKAIDAAAADGDHVVFTTSPVQMEETLRGAMNHPEIKFLNCSLNIAHNAVRTYYGKMYESKYLLGALAATIATNHKIGYLADYPIYGTVANINAFALGAAMIDPRAQIHLKWSTMKDTDWRSEFLSEGVFVISGPDFIKPEAPTREYGLYMIDPIHDDEIQNIGAPMWDWGKYYELILRSILDGSWDQNSMVSNDTALNYWYGFKSGVVNLILSDKISYHSRKLMHILQRGIEQARLYPFAGELYSQDGMIKPAGSPNLSRHEIITMSWLADNVIGSIPEKSLLNQEAQDTIAVAGVTADAKDPVTKEPDAKEAAAKESAVKEQSN